MKDWFYDESVHVGVDYSRTDNADIYDEQMDFRDYDQEVRAFIEKTGIDAPKNMVAADIGCGTGAFAVHAATYFKRIYAVDVSEAMQQIARSKAQASGRTNVHFVRAGFLQFKPEEQVDVINTKWAFHHLPDFWKQAALLNMNAMLKPGGILFMADLVFRFDTEFEENTDAMLARLSTEHDEAFIEECKTHIREEYSTFDWILHGMIERAGFSVESVVTDDELATEYVCRKVKSV